MKNNGLIDQMNNNDIGVSVPCYASNSKFITFRNVLGNLVLYTREGYVIETNVKEIERPLANAIYKEYVEQENAKVLKKTKKCK